MRVVLESLRALQGIATTGELRRLGIDRDKLEVSYMHGKIWRVRKGLWCVPELPPEVRRARRLKGRLACVSALVHHGQIEDQGFALHISAPAGQVSWHPTSPDDGVVRHWSRRPLDGDRHAVSVAVAWKQFELCQRLGRADVRLLEPDSL